MSALESDDSFGIGFVSAGFITRESHAPSVQYIPEAHVAGVMNPTVSKAEALAEEVRGDTAAYGDVRELVADENVDGLWVTSPNHTRIEVMEAVAAELEQGADLAGVAFEKPIARNVRESQAVLDIVEEQGLPHAYLENWPHEPDIAQMRELLWERGRDAGRPYIARSQAEHGGPHSAWFWDGVRQGGGALTDMLCHALAGNQCLLSDPEAEAADENENGVEAVEVTADAETLKWSQPEYARQLREEHGVDYGANPADDYARATVTYEDADGQTVISEATGSWCYVGAGVRRQIELLGPEYSGQVLSDEASSSVFFSDEAAAGEGWAEKQNATAGRMPLAAAGEVNGGYVAENRDAVLAFVDGENGTLDLHDGMDVMELCMAAYLAAEEDRTVDPRTADLASYTPPPARD